jgi:hypothetical protein
VTKKGINYDTGFFPGNGVSRPQFDEGTVKRELEIIAADLGCSTVRVSGGDLSRMATAARHAVDAGLELWLSPMPAELDGDAVLDFLEAGAKVAEQLRRQGASVVFVAGCELSVFAHGFLPGSTAYDRMSVLMSPDPAVWRSLEDVPKRLNDFLSEAAIRVRRAFGGRVTYASAPWEPVDWTPFDLVSVDAYRDAGNAATYEQDLQARLAGGKPVAVTEFGCCTYRGAAGRGGMGWAVLDESSATPRVASDLVRDELEQVTYMNELFAILMRLPLEAAFWFTFAGYRLIHREDPRTDMDMASYGVVKMLDGRRGTRYPDMAWEPKQAFDKLRRIDAAS